jgi:hypothetical protein
MRGQMDPEVDALLRAGDIEGAARRAMDKGLHRRAAELLALLGRHAEAAVVALEAGEWRSALDAALASGDERVQALRGALPGGAGGGLGRDGARAGGGRRAHRRLGGAQGADRERRPQRGLRALRARGRAGANAR